MMKIALLLAVLTFAINVASTPTTQHNKPSTTRLQASTDAPEKQKRATCPGHGHELGGAAVDINALNGKPVSLYGKDPDLTNAVNDFQAAANRSGSGGHGAAAENYGPAGLWQNGKAVQDAKLLNQFHDYIHILPSKTVESK
jgi:hypothetical protein